MEAAASVITFISFSIESINLIHKVLTGIEDGPESVSTTVSNVKILQWALKQLAHRMTTSGQLPPTEFQIQIQKCSQDLSAFASKLTKFEALETDSRARKLWKRLKAVLSEKDLEKMTEAVGAYSSSLNLYMTTLSGPNTQHFELLRTDLARADVQQQQQLSAISTSLDHASAASESMRSRLDQGLQLLASNLNDSRAQSEANQQEMNHKLSLVWNAIQSLAARTEPATTLKSLVAPPTEEETPGSSTLPYASPSTYSQTMLPLGHQIPATMLENEKILDCINRLCGMVNQCENTSNEETIDSVIEDLQTIIRAVMSQSNDRASVKELRCVSGLLDSAQTLSINGQAQRSPRLNQAARHEQRLETYEIGNGTLKVRTKRRYLQHHSADGGPIPKRQRSDIGYTTSTLTFLPKFRDGMMFSAIIQQQTSHTGFFSPIPLFQANYIRPRDSLVFQLIEEGRLSELITLLREGKASLRDHDELGRPLLWFAATYMQPHICRYLLENRADLDVFCPDRFDESHDRSLILTCMYNDDDEEEEELRRANECRRILLEAGADPTDEADDIGSAFYQVFAWTSKLDSMRTFLDFSVGFAGIDWRDSEGKTPLLLVSSYEGPRRKDSFELLLNRGANIHDVDNNGWGCLHWCLYRINDRWLSLDGKGQADAIVCLIRNGADVRARSNSGMSVSDIAYSISQDNVPLNSCRRDVWDFALAVCGYNVLEIRGNFRRVAGYTSTYDFLVFQYLWSGHEHLCPYPDDLVQVSSDYL